MTPHIFTPADVDLAREHACKPCLGPACDTRDPGDAMDYCRRHARTVSIVVRLRRMQRRRTKCAS